MAFCKDHDQMGTCDECGRGCSGCDPDWQRVHARIDTLTAERDAALAAHAATIRQAEQQAQEARTQRGIVLAILGRLGLPLRDWEAEGAVCDFVRELRAERDAALRQCREQSVLIEALSPYAGELDTVRAERDAAIARAERAEAL